MRRALASICCLLCALACGSPAAAAAPLGPASVEELLDYRLRTGKGELFRVFPLSETVFYAVFDSSGTRARVFEGLDPMLLGALATPAALTVSGEQLEAAYGGAVALAGEAQLFRDALEASGMLPARGAGEPPPRRVLITVIHSAGVRRVLDFTLSEGQEWLTGEREDPRRARGGAEDEIARAMVFGPDGPRGEMFEVWRFDHLTEEVEARSREAELDRQVAAARRARFHYELVRSLGYLDPEWEPAVIGWLESRVSPEDRRTLVQLLQIAGIEEIDAPTLVREAPAHLYDPRVMSARLFRRLEQVTGPPGARGLRRLDPAQFPDPELRARAQAFYERFFVVKARQRFAAELRPEISSFLRAHGAAVGELAGPFLAAQLGDA